MTRESDKGGRLVVGGAAKANLLPPEVGIAAKGRVMRRNAIALVILVILVVIAGYAGGAVLSLAAQAQLAVANERTQELVSEQAKYAEVRQIKIMLDTADAAERVGTSTEIDWKAFLNDIQKSLPAGTLVTNVVAETATPITDFAQPSVPLQGDRIGELKFTATSTSLPNVEKWLEALAKLDGYVDASPGSIQLDAEAKTYQVTITMHIDRGALLLRYDQEAKDLRDKERAEKAAAEGSSDAEAGSTDPESGATPEPSPVATEEGGQ